MFCQAIDIIIKSQEDLPAMAFVEFASISEAVKAVKFLHGLVYRDRVIKVSSGITTQREGIICK